MHHDLVLIDQSQLGQGHRELHTVITWLTGYAEKGIAKVIADKTAPRTFRSRIPRPSPGRCWARLTPLCANGRSPGCLG
ncbi:MAG: DUF2200 family protein [Flavobacteriales bacterium]|nr:MAG: DUF2200 family protein [Flavobacteriales bacterium]